MVVTSIITSLQKIPIIWKKASSKSCLALHFLQKSQWAHMSISQPTPPPQSGTRGLYRLIWLQYYSAQKRQITFTVQSEGCQNSEGIEDSKLLPCKNH